MSLIKALALGGSQGLPPFTLRVTDTRHPSLLSSEFWTFEFWIFNFQSIFRFWDFHEVGILHEVKIIFYLDIYSNIYKYAMSLLIYNKWDSHSGRHCIFYVLEYTYIYNR